MFLCKVHYMRDRERGVVWEESIILVISRQIAAYMHHAHNRIFPANSSHSNDARASQHSNGSHAAALSCAAALSPLTRARSRRQFASCFYPPPSQTRQVRWQPPAAALSTCRSSSCTGTPLCS